MLEAVLKGLVYGLVMASAWYLPFRLSSLLGFKRRKVLYAAALLIIVLSVALMFGISKYASPVAGMVSIVAGYVFCLYLYTVLALLVVDAIRLVLRIPNRVAGWSAVAVAIFFTVLGAWQAQDFKVSETEIAITGLEQPLTLMHISDLHIGHQRGRNYLQKVVDTTNRLQPDLVLLNGDLIDSNYALESGDLAPLRDFKAPVFMTTGNHEYYIDTERALALITGSGARLLDNEMVEIRGLQLVGLSYMNADDNSYDPHRVNNLTIKDELPKISRDVQKPTLLMHHSPVGMTYVLENGIDLMLAGHTHGGQVFPATILEPLLFSLTRGLHVIDGLTVFVSQGAGTFGPRLRLGSANEINLLRLTPKS